MRPKLVSKVSLTEEASRLLSEMMEAVKKTDGGAKFSPSSFSSFVLERYYKKAFQSELKLIANQFFDERKFLKKVIEEGGDIKAAIEQINNRYKTKKGVTNKS